MSIQVIWRRVIREGQRDGVILALLIVLAALLRLVALDHLPPGLYHDEAYNGLDALTILRGQTPIFFETNNGREPLFIYLIAASVAVWGRSPLALRLVSALVGVLTVPAFYGLGRVLYDRRVGLIMACLTVTMVWTLNLSRMAFRAVTMPPLQTLALILLWRGLRQRRWADMAWAGVIYGISFYTYLAARFSPLALFFFILYTLVWHRQMFWLHGWALFTLLGLVVVAPLGSYFLTHWASTLERAGQVAIWNTVASHAWIATLLRQLWRTALGFFYQGDFIPRHNVPLRPIFDPLIALAFLAGLGLALRRARRAPAYGLCLIWFGVMLWPTLLAEGAPHMLRATGILPVLLVFPALGLVKLGEVLAAQRRQKLGLALTVGILVISAGLNVSAYARHLQSETLYYQMEAGATTLAAEVNHFLGLGWQGTGLTTTSPGRGTPGRQVYLAARLWEGWPAVRYLCPASSGLMILAPDGRVPASVPAETREAQDVLVLVWPYEDYRPALALGPANRLLTVREGARERGDLEPESRLLYVAFHSQPAEGIPQNGGIVWEGGIRLLGYRLQTIGQNKLQVELYWQTDQPLDTSYTVFCHVAGAGGLVGQHDGPPAGGYYPTERWRVGEVIEDRHLVPLSAPYAAQTMRVVVGLYRLETMQRLRLTDQAGQPTAQTDWQLLPQP